MFNTRPILRGLTQVGTGKQACGAVGSPGHPLGGGAGYAETVAPTGSPATCFDELHEALSAAKSGDTVYVAGDATIECTERVYIEQSIEGKRFAVPAQVVAMPFFDPPRKRGDANTPNTPGNSGGAA